MMSHVWREALAVSNLVHGLIGSRPGDRGGGRRQGRGCRRPWRC